MTEFATLRLKTYSYLANDNGENKNARGTKKCVVKTKLKFEDCKHFL